MENRINAQRTMAILTAVVVGTTMVSLAWCQPRRLYELSPQDLERIQAYAEGLRAARQPGWEQGYIAIAQDEWKREEQAGAIARLFTVMRETVKL
jgi:hypothetical protein